MELCEAIGRMRAVAEGPMLAGVDADALRILLSAVARDTTLMACVGCGKGVRWRYAVKEMCPDCAATAIDRLGAELERSGAIREHVASLIHRGYAAQAGRLLLSRDPGEAARIEVEISGRELARGDMR
jgi:predicted RNA-binding Zn-ribbon protein involved in translation (DUF1610 family)